MKLVILVFITLFSLLTFGGSSAIKGKPLKYAASKKWWVIDGGL